MKSTVTITVSGRPMSGKTAIIAAIAQQLKTLGFEIDISWWEDRVPKLLTDRDATAYRAKKISERSKIVIVEEQAKRIQGQNK